MAQAATYEIHTLKGDRWLIDAILHDKESALNEARNLLASPHFIGVKVVAEIVNDETGQTSCRTLFNHRKDQERKIYVQNPVHKERVRVTAAPKKQEVKSSGSLTQAMVSLIGISGVVLALIGAALYFTE